MTIGILNIGTIESHKIETMYLLGWSKGHVRNLKDYDNNISFNGNLTYAPWS